MIFDWLPGRTVCGFRQVVRDGGSRRDGVAPTGSLTGIAERAGPQWREVLVIAGFRASTSVLRFGGMGGSEKSFFFLRLSLTHTYDADTLIG